MSEGTGDIHYETMPSIQVQEQMIIVTEIHSKVVVTENAVATEKFNGGSQQTINVLETALNKHKKELDEAQSKLNTLE
jgi:hypothetical protein